jgi:tetratricopeptide (TPR) repeat protein
MTAGEFAAAVNCAERTLRRYLSGERAIPVDVLVAWERVTGLMPGTLRGGRDGPRTRYLPDERPPLPAAAHANVEVFVGRGLELQRLNESARMARTAGRVAMITGDPGVGKTRLAAAAARRAYDEGFTVLWGHCDEHLALPFQPFAEALRAFVPNFGALIADTDRSRYGSAGFRRDLVTELLFEDVTDLVVRIGRQRPVLLVLDDLHWAAKSSVQLLRHLIVGNRPMPLFVLATANKAELDPQRPLAGQLVDLSQPAGIDVLDLGGFSKAEIEELLEARHGGADQISLAQELQAQTGGNPFFVTELLRDLSEKDGRPAMEVVAAGRPNPTVQAVISQRLGRRSATMRSILPLAAVAGATFEAAILADVVSEAASEAEVVAALDEARAARLIDEVSPGAYRFAHQLAHRAVYDQVSPTRRTLVHRQVAEAIERVHAKHLERYWPALARHYAAAGRAAPLDRAAETIVAAGRQAFDQADLAGAASYARLGLDLLERVGGDNPARHCDLLCLAVLAEPASERGKRIALEAIEAASAANDPARVARATELYAEYVAFGRLDETAVTLCRRALDMVSPDDRVNRGRLLAALATNLAWSPKGGSATQTEAETLCAEAAALLGDDGDSWVRWRVYDAYCIALHASPDLGRRLAVATAAVEAGQHGAGIWHRAIARLAAGDRTGFEHDRAHYAQSAHPWYRAVAVEWDALLALLDGRWDEVEHHANQALKAFPDDVNFQNVYWTQLFALYWETGRLAEVLPLVEAAATQSPDTPGIRAAAALAHLEVGEYDTARRLLVSVADNLATLPRDFSWTVTLALVIEIAVRSRDLERLAAAAEMLLPFSGQLIVVGMGTHVHGAVDRFLAIAAAASGRIDEAEALFAAAVNVEEQISAPALAARTRYWWSWALAQSESNAARIRSQQLHAQVIDACKQFGQGGLAALAARPG